SSGFAACVQPVIPNSAISAKPINKIVFTLCFIKKLLKIFEIQPPHRMCGYCRLYCDVLAGISLTKLGLKAEQDVPFSYCCSSRFCQGTCLSL
ncbi:hypothetical protein HMPREF9193_02224, partial [Treponema lecithinolyticum ATCC 700332]